MIILSYGMTKSGSTLAFELCKAILEVRGFAQRRLPDGVVDKGHHINFLSDPSTSALMRLLSEVRSKEKIAIKLHSSIENDAMLLVQEQIVRGYVKLHINYRDPREVSLSLVDAGAYARGKELKAFSEIETLKDAAKTTQRQLSICRRWGSIPGAMHLFYNDVAFDMRATTERLLDDFGLRRLTDQEFDQVTSIVNSDAFTQRNKAVKDRFKDELTVRQSEQLVDTIKGAKSFIRRVCEGRDHSWFNTRPGADADGG